MKRPIATVLTIIVFLLYGLPSFVFCYFGAQMALGSTKPAYRAGFEAGSNGLSSDIILPVGVGLLCIFVYLIVVPILVGLLSFRTSKAKESSDNTLA